MKASTRPKQPYPMVEVIWDDAAGHDDQWAQGEDFPVKPELVISVGFLVLKNNKYIVIAQDIDADGKHNGRTQIPRGMVKKMKVLRRADA